MRGKEGKRDGRGRDGGRVRQEWQTRRLKSKERDGRKEGERASDGGAERRGGEACKLLGPSLICLLADSECQAAVAACTILTFMGGVLLLENETATKSVHQNSRKQSTHLSKLTKVPFNIAGCVSLAQ